ncbi:glycerate kinase [Geobacter sp. FeAm09]|uniref:glycerate kinase type-2 family protein n=1 Tax=Geobacter sp. FeAm09 TaxID=2597769 RepID=UPI00197AA65D|nr:glycerate kinase [Geobacter sp. FeAm09]
MTQADKHILQSLFKAALSAVEPGAALAPHLERVGERLRSEGLQRLVVAGFGKAAIPMALAVQGRLGDLVSGGLVVVPHGITLPPFVTGGLKSLDLAFAGHPHPDHAGEAAARRIMELVRSCDRQTLLLLLVSGGGSALLAAPAEGITLEEKRATAALLMAAGADIHELNTVRKHLSAVKGGQLARLAFPARVVSLMISDVPGDRPDVIASGPAVPDPTTFGDALAVLGRFGLTGRVPPAVRRRLEQGNAGMAAETPKPGDPLFAKVESIIAARNRDALDAAAVAAEGLGLAARVSDDIVAGEAREAGRRLAHEALRCREELPPGQRLCLVSGGETTVAVTGNGKGGRNQELALAFALEIAATPGITLLSAGTDGIDGPTDAAGAIVDGDTVPLARLAGLDPLAALAANDAYPLLDACGALLKCGPTGTNVMDMQMCLITGGSVTP